MWELCAGVWAQKVLHPSSGLTKEYVVTCSQEPSRRDLEKVAGGCEVDGAFVTPVAVGARQGLRPQARHSHRHRRGPQPRGAPPVALPCSWLISQTFAIDSTLLLFPERGEFCVAKDIDLEREQCSIWPV